MPSDVIQNVIIRIGAQETVASVMTRALGSVRQSVAGVEATLQSIAASATASAAKSAAAFSTGRGDLAAATRAVVSQTRSELQKLAQEPAVRLAVEIASEQFDEARLKISRFLSENTKGARLKWAVALEFKNEMIDEARRAVVARLAPISRAIQVPITIARQKLDVALIGVSATLYRWQQEKGVMRLVFAIGQSTGSLLSRATSVLAPLRQMAAAGVNVVIKGTAAGLANAARTALSSIASVGAGAVAAAGAAAMALGVIGAAVGIAIGAVLGAVVGLRRAVGQAIEDTGNLADRLGATTEGLMALQHAARTNGSSVDVMNGSLERMSRTIGDALRGSDEAAGKFAKLGLSAGDLSKMDADKAFEAIAGQIAALPSPAERASAAIAVFGRESGSLQNLLMKGTAGIAAAREEAERMGLALGRVDVAKVAAANAAMDALANQLKGYLTQAAVATAPYVQAIAEKLLSLAPTGATVGQAIMSAMEGVAVAIAYCADVVNLLLAGWYALKAGVIAVVAGIVKAIDLVGGAMTQLMNLMPGVEMEWTSTFASMADSMAEDVIAAADQAAEAYGKFSRGDASASVRTFFAEATAAAQENAAEIARNAEALREAGRAAGQLGNETEAAAEKASKLAEEMARIASDRATLGLTEVQKEVAKLRELGATQLQIDLAIETAGVREQIETVLGSIKESGADDPWAAWERGLEVLDQLRQSGKLTAEQFDSVRQQLNASLESNMDAMADRIRESVRTPAESALAEVNRAQQLLAARRLDQASYDRLVQQQFEQGAGGAAAPAVKFASGRDAGMTTGVVEATRERLALMTPVNKIVGNTQQMVGFLQELVRRTPQRANQGTRAFGLD